MSAPGAPLARSERYLEELRREFPSLRVVRKADDGLSKLLDVLLRIGTLNQQREYMTRYTTVIGTTIYTPSTWEERPDAERYVTLRHEAVHLRQARRMGQVAMSLRYGLWYLPVVLSWGRAQIEWEAYAETLRAMAEVHGLAYARSKPVREHLVRQFTSAAYGWMWPFPAEVNRWIDEELARIAARS
ncbi:MAG: hypothetical protein K1X94_32635 [Sandaracinaceae bacterium]|nr:hypothetical protein [Sandaracinaceae bacterium]